MARGEWMLTILGRVARAGPTLDNHGFFKPPQMKRETGETLTETLLAACGLSLH